MVLSAPAVFRFTACACPERHRRAAEILGATTDRVPDADIGKVLSDQLLTLMHTVDVPNGLSAVGFSTDDLPALVEGTLPQQIRHLASRSALKATICIRLFEESMTLW